ncbi:YdaS family helix-turn-helix protein [Acinetobacter sp. A47]|uniref:YdaS family helix-turn-helix protein n=1 Tax=Acinetobacter sp. A47 TaxID=1561217 RepID=UPI000570310B|nr:YdaS family helix-turn-helix protein [Acinetobacter sp. A47]
MSQLKPCEAAALAIDAAGGASLVSRKITANNPEKPLTPQAVQKWKKFRCPAERVLDLESLQKLISRFQLRPDLYKKKP